MAAVGTPFSAVTVAAINGLDHDRRRRSSPTRRPFPDRGRGAGTGRRPRRAPRRRGCRRVDLRSDDVLGVVADGRPRRGAAGGRRSTDAGGVGPTFIGSVVGAAIRPSRTPGALKLAVSPRVRRPGGCCRARVIRGECGSWRAMSSV